MEKVDLLGVKIDNASLQEVLEKVSGFLVSPNQHYIVTPNPEFLVAAQTDKHFRDILNYADIAVADGVGLQKAARFSGKRLQRVTGVDLVWAICELAEQKKYSVYFLGGQSNIAQQTADALKTYFPNLNVAGCESGGEVTNPQTLNDSIISNINRINPTILFVALGHVKQEKWIFYHLDKLPSVRLAIGVGGAFDYICGATPRAPQFLQRIGLEWLFRLIIEPKRWRRIVDAIVIFPFLVIKNKILPTRESKNV